jgi:FkbM family methyltransferase
MNRLIRKLLAAFLGTEKYLEVVSSSYIHMVNAGIMAQKYPELFFLDKIIKPEYHCIDLGANVGYYSTRLSKLTRKSGKIYAVEPVTLFRNLLEKNLKKFDCNNVELIAYALGSENKAIKMGTPEIAGVFRHGLTKIIDSPSENFAQTYEVQMRLPDELFQNLSRLDYIKCDVEGYEVHIFPFFTKTLSRFHPLIQMEISTVNNRKQIFDILLPLGYKIFGLADNSLTELTEMQALYYNKGDFYFKCD